MLGALPNPGSRLQTAVGFQVSVGRGGGEIKGAHENFASLLILRFTFFTLLFVNLRSLNFKFASTTEFPFVFR